MFYILDDAPELGEMFCPINCFLASSLILADIDPIKDLGEQSFDGIKFTLALNQPHSIFSPPPPT